MSKPDRISLSINIGVNMKLIQLLILTGIAVSSSNALAAVFKCTDDPGDTSYQSAPCIEENSAPQIKIKTRGLMGLINAKKKQTSEQELKQQLAAELEKQSELELTRIRDTKEQSALNQLLIENNPMQFSSYAIPPYLPEQSLGMTTSFQVRLPEIEKFRRIAAQKALATGQCKRVESSQLSMDSTMDTLVFSIDCSSAKTFKYNEIELAR